MAKIFMQRLWQLKVSWDEPLPSDITKEWQSYFNNLNLLNTYSVPRHVRVIAYILRFKNNATSRNIKQLGPLTSSELNLSLMTLIKIVQNECFGNEISDLSIKRSVNNKSKLLKLNPFMDKGILRVGGRIKHSPFAIDKKHPIVLPNDHVFSKLLVEYEHKRLLHAGPQALLASLRERFWILSGRNLVRKIVRNCMTCFRSNPGENVEYLMADLPSQLANFQDCSSGY
ncbi:hypothetical protein NQ315_013462 [Exocentrus adspersus]|uniref:Integrase zinc-binding domain-containing protein n=1 Tax=Exocentrus adspersus TaxID=1586481 RepID=A0AAV8VE90_9CUCU|nr:hypothetical protein NQ315_013462 [Exocentrus adspersus]